MAYTYDAQEKGYRLVCEGCGHRSAVVSLDEKAVQGLEWYCSDLQCKRSYLAKQRERFQQGVVERGMSPTQAELEIAKLRWDLMPDGERIQDS